MNPTSGATATPPSKSAAASPRRTGTAEVSFADALLPAGDPAKPLATGAPPIAELAQEVPGAPGNELGLAGLPPPATSPGSTPVRGALPTAGPPDPVLDPGEPPHRSRPDLLDPAARHVAQLGPLFQPPATSTPNVPAAAPETNARASLESLLPELVRKIAWAGDGNKGSVRLELGAGALSGGTLVVHAEGGRVRVELSTPPGIDAEAWRRKLEARLEGRGIAVDEIAVR